MRVQTVTAAQNRRIVAGLPFVEALARRMAASMPNSIDIGDLVQDGVLGLIDAAHRFDEGRGIKFETFAERRVRGAMIDALRRDAWPRGVRRQRRELDAAREALRRELGHEPSMADLAARVGSDEKRLSRTIVRINTIEATSPLATGEHFDESSLPTALVPSEPDAPDTAYEKAETRERVRAAIQSLPWRERKVIGLYYYGEVTMKEIGAEIGVNESRVSQLHARAIRRLRESLGEMGPQQVAEMRAALVDLASAKAPWRRRRAEGGRRAVAAPAASGAAARVLTTPWLRASARSQPRRSRPRCGRAAVTRQSPRRDSTDLELVHLETTKGGDAGIPHAAFSFPPRSATRRLAAGPLTAHDCAGGPISPRALPSPPSAGPRAGTAWRASGSPTLVEELLGVGAGDVAGDEDDPRGQRRRWPSAASRRRSCRRRAASSDRRSPGRRGATARG